MATHDREGIRIIIGTTYRIVSIDVINGDITKISASCLVNPYHQRATRATRRYNGYRYAIHEAAGLELLVDLMNKYKSGDGVTECAYPTAPHGMAPRVRRIIHAVGQDYRELGNDQLKIRKTERRRICRVQTSYKTLKSAPAVKDTASRRTAHLVAKHAIPAPSTREMRSTKPPATEPPGPVASKKRKVAETAPPKTVINTGTKHGTSVEE